MATDYDNTKQQRKAVRTSFSKTVNKLQEVLISESPNIEDMDILLDQLTEKYQTLRISDDKFLELCQKKGCTQEEYEKEYESAQEYYEKFSTFKIRCSRVKSKQESSGSIIGASQSSSTTVTNTKQNLPEIQLPKFDGDPRNWLTFWTVFSKIHEDRRIDIRDKFQYLLQSMKPESIAKQIVESFPATEANYEKAVTYLQERFGKESVLIQIYVRELLKLVISDKSKINLLTMYDKLQTQIRALESLGLTQDKYSFLLFPLVESALPTDLIKIWERQKNTVTETGKNDLQLLMDFVKNEVETEFRIKITREVLGPEKLNIKKNKCTELQSMVPTSYELINTNNNKSTNNFYENKFKKIACIFCDKPHLSENCNDVYSMDLECKKDIVRKKNACFACLKTKHRANQCRSKHKCPLCKNRHFVILCPDLKPRKAENISNADQNEIESKTSTLNNYISISNVFLQTIIVRIKNGTKEMYIRAIYDTGAMKSYISNDIAQKMKLVCTGETMIKQSLFGGIETPEKVYKNYLIELSDVDRNYKCKLEVLGQKCICSNIAQIPYGPWINELRSRGIKINDLANNNYKVDKEIKLLIGADIAAKLFTGKVINLKSGISVINTKLGYTLFGKFNPGTEPTVESSASHITSLLVKEKCISELWRLDNLGITEPSLSKSKIQLQEETHKYFEETLIVNKEGRYEVALPWVLESSLLPDNKMNVEKYISNAKRKLTNLKNFDDYCNVFEEWLALGIIEKAPTEKLRGVYYLPHRPVIKENSTTRIRPVFNASYHLPGNPSLNDCLATGPNLIELIPSILNRFRMNYVGVTADIEKAFLQISIREKDRDFLRFLWFGKENQEQVEEYRHKRVVFGITCSPYLLAATLQYHLDRVTENLKYTANILKKSFYVDNCVTSLNSETEMRKFFLESKSIMSLGHFNLRCWKSNISNKIFEEDSSLKESISLLGLLWHTDTDMLSCKIEQVTNSEETITKRIVLAVAHQVFDVIGYTAPVMLIPKMILQETWNSKLKWDDSLPYDLAKKFKSWRQKLHLLSDINVARWFGLRSNNESISFHLFCDSSKKAYGACVFIRVENIDEIKISLVHAKSRVAPLKPITIPRLELLACSIGSRLLSSIIKDLDIPEVNIYCWTDSTTALCWIKRDKNWGTFIHNRVLEIRSLTSPTMWRHVSGILNPADLLSRGCSAEQLVERKWWEGPNWLREKEENWPKSNEEPSEDLVNSEVRKTIIANLVNNEENFNWYYKFFSSFKKIVRMLGWIFRFYNNIRKIDKTLSKDLTTHEIEKGERALMLLIQKESFKGENDDKLKQLRPITDCHGLIRAKSNVAYREDKYNFKFPIILPSDHPVVKLLIISVHNDLLHAGTSLLMSNLRENYWILKSRKTIRNCIRKCVKCQKFKAKKCETIPGILPNDRVRDACVFEIVGCDLAGPLYLKDGRKAYIVLFTCAVYRAVHLELITSLSTESFFQSLRRFIARRGRPTTIYSDNGKNFVGAEKILQAVDWDGLRFKAAEQKIKWKFNPPSAAWWGGWWERLIQIVKQILRKTLGRASLNYEELQTVLCDCERVVNSRPLTYVSEDIDDDFTITPEIFLHETPQSGVPDLDNVDKAKLSKRNKYLQRMRESLRLRFRTEYLGQLRQQSVKNYIDKPLKVDEIVLLEDINKKRSYWNLARVLKIIPGRDGQIRLALIKTENSELLRPVQRLYRLELENPASNTMDNPIPLTTSSGRRVKPPTK